MSVIVEPTKVPKSIRLVLLGIIWIGVSAGIYYGISSFDMQKFDALSQRGVEVTGKIISVSPGNRGRSSSIRYSFIAKNGKVYFGIGIAAYANLSLQTTWVGQAVLVFYDPLNPAMSTVGYPKRERENELAGIILAGIFGATIFIFVLIGKGFLK